MQLAPLRLLTALILASVAVPMAARAECPIPLDDAGFRASVDRAQTAIDDGDVIGHGAAWRDLQARIPCLQAPPPADAWAEFLVGFAVVEHALGRAWEPALATALRIHPAVRRDYGPERLQTWTPPPVGATTPLLPEIWVDGLPADRAAARLDGPHILQRRRDGVWESLVVSDAPPPSDWTPTAPTEEPPPATPSLPAAPRPGKLLRIVGYSLAGAGVAGAIGSALYTSDGIRDPEGDDPWTEGEVRAIKAVNAGSWGLAAVGVGLAITGHVQGARQVSAGVGPRGVWLRVRR